VTSGTAATRLHGAKDGQVVGLGQAVKDMHVTGSELGSFVTPGGFVVGSTASGSIVIDGIVRDIISLVGTRDNAQIVFSGSASTFTTLMAQADNGILVKADVTTTAGVMYLDGDFEDSSTMDDTNTIGFTDGRTITSKLVLTLESTTGVTPAPVTDPGNYGLTPAGSLTLKAGSGIVLLNSLYSKTVSKPLVLNAD
jgi:hypothetical protein